MAAGLSVGSPSVNESVVHEILRFEFWFSEHPPSIHRFTEIQIQLLFSPEKIEWRFSVCHLPPISMRCEQRCNWEWRFEMDWFRRDDSFSVYAREIGVPVQLIKAEFGLFHRHTFRQTIVKFAQAHQCGVVPGDHVAVMRLSFNGQEGSLNPKPPKQKHQTEPYG
jgi:hypothetical protein